MKDVNSFAGCIVTNDEKIFTAVDRPPVFCRLFLYFVSVLNLIIFFSVSFSPEAYDGVVAISLNSK